jgi:hypothetical protein
MQLHLHPTGSISIAEVRDDAFVVANGHMAGELILNASFAGADALLLRKEQLPIGFFDLKSGLAGEILQAFSTYRMRLAIVGDFAEHTGDAWLAFVRESNRMGQVSFVSTTDEALALLGS